MYRHNQILGCGLTAFGAGLLIGLWIGNGFWAHCFGFGIVIIGGNILCKR